MSSAGTIAGVDSTGSQTTAGLSANIPIFQGGLPAARIRQAEAFAGSGCLSRSSVPNGPWSRRRAPPSPTIRPR